MLNNNVLSPTFFYKYFINITQQQIIWLIFKLLEQVFNLLIYLLTYLGNIPFLLCFFVILDIIKQGVAYSGMIG